MMFLHQAADGETVEAWVSVANRAPQARGGEPVPSLIRRRNRGSGQTSLGFFDLSAHATGR
jgi:hypothetical protein